ncbi:1-deoxy-D-xylulose-5-phosphate reductoisomerase [Olegusella massiliensis]|uniref:1-deoxy-D-xylulose-5-phosphate reductoisomerase n=1 Tax=Olegusella massiliensis TaxID=1776381 RepID=UPI00405570FC
MSIFEDTSPKSPRPRPLRVAVLGASGSIGTQTLDVCRQHADKLQVVALSVWSATDRLVAAAREFGVKYVGIGDKTHAHDGVLDGLPLDCQIFSGDNASTELAILPEVDCVVSAVVGFAGIRCGYEALKAKKILAYANKESIVCGGDLLMPLAGPGQLIPVDSEHSAIFQCLVGERTRDVYCLWLTCSGGPFYGKKREELAGVKAADALAHPTWAMGPKITIDSATLANKGLEVLEAHQLFEVSVDQVRVLIQRQSRIHSMVEFSDGVVMAQLGPSDMRLPIQYALSYPERWETPAARIDWCSVPAMSFGEADEKTFGCLALAKRAGKQGGTAPCVMNAANEIANLAFRQGRCGFLDIEHIIRSVMDEMDSSVVESIEQLVAIDAEARRRATNVLERCGA